jgi:uncharacterized protein
MVNSQTLKVIILNLELLTRGSMKTLEEIKSQLEVLKPLLLKKYQIQTIGVFGSYCRGEQKAKSDVDILVTFIEPNNIDLIDFIEIKQFLSRKLGVKVDLVKKNALKPMIKDKILEETIYI